MSLSYQQYNQTMSTKPRIFTICCYARRMSLWAWLLVKRDRTLHNKSIYSANWKKRVVGILTSKQLRPRTKGGIACLLTHLGWTQTPQLLVLVAATDQVGNPPEICKKKQHAHTFRLHSCTGFLLSWNLLLFDPNLGRKLWMIYYEIMQTIHL